MKTFAKFCLLPFLILALLLFVVLSSILPTEWGSEAKLHFEASPAEVYAHVDEIRRWGDWAQGFSDTTGEGTGPELVFEGPERGVGAKMSRTNSKMAVKITGSDPSRGVWYDLVIRTGDTVQGAILFETREGQKGCLVRSTLNGSCGDSFGGKLRNVILDSGLGLNLALDLGRLKGQVEGNEKNE